MKSLRCVLMVHFLFSFLLPLAHSKTVMIHAVGISPSNSSENLPTFFENTIEFIRFCEKSRIPPSDCHVFGNRTGKVARSQSDLTTQLEKEGLSQERVQSDFRAKDVLKRFQTSLEEAKEGDQIVLSIDDHGSPGNGNSSCISLGSDPICEGDLKVILDRYKRKGVKVFIAAQACFSGAFTALSNSEVCTYVSSSRYNASLTSWFDGGLWRSFKEIKSKEKPLSLEEVRRATFFELNHRDGGGFGSEVIKTRLCSESKVVFANLMRPQAKDLEAYAKIRRKTRFNLPILSQYQDRLGELSDQEIERRPSMGNGYACFSDPDPIFSQIGAAIKSINRSLNVKDPILYLKEKYCPLSGLTPANPKPSELCSAIAQFEKEVNSIQEGLSQVSEEARQKRTALENQDASFPSGSEAIRGELLSKALAVDQEAISKTLKAIKKTKGLVPVLERIWSEMCIDTSSGNNWGNRYETFKSWLTGVWTHFNLFLEDLTPSQRKDYEEARACENSFIFP